jgi:hypothetical protein
MPVYPHKYYGSFGAYVIIAAAVFLLCWLCNAHRMGRFQKKKATAPGTDIGKSNHKTILILCGLVLGALLGLAFRVMF